MQWDVYTETETQLQAAALNHAQSNLKKSPGIIGRVSSSA